MQLLGIIMRQFKLMPFIVLASSGALADNDCNRKASTNQEIIKCSQESFIKIDKAINEQYRFLIESYDEKQKKHLVETQRSWIKFKEKYCDDMYDSVYPGHEAPIDRLSCLTQITSTRFSELIFLRTGVISDGFYKAVSIVNKKFTNYDYGQAVNIVGGDSNLGELWENYIMRHCAMTLALYKEDSKMCVARMRFQTPIN